MEKLKLMTIVGTRPEIIRLSATIKCADIYFEHSLVHTGQNWDYNLNEVFFKDLGLRAPDYYLNSVGKNLGETVGNIIAKSYDLMVEHKPDAILILGDTNSALAAISAKRLKIPIFHMEAGNRCWDWNVPEMINRKIVDHIADINLPYTENSRRYLLSEGVDGKTVFVTGSPMTEVLNNQKDLIDASDVLDRLQLKAKEYFIFSSHREENIDNEKNFMSLMSGINEIAEKYKKPIIFSVHPRSKKMIEQRKFKFHPLVKEMTPFGFNDYIKLQSNALCVLSDSGTLSEESAILNFPAVQIRTSTERPEVLDKGNIIVGGITGREIAQAVELSVSMQKAAKQRVIPFDYMDTNVSEKVVRVIQSYTSIVNQTVWNKRVGD
jgi:UDP-N-acetylglucosamine 2-epimerase (non-hydrolysing)